MPALKDCFQLLNDFDPDDIGELEDRATKLAGSDPVTNATYLAAAHELAGEYRAKVSAGKPAASGASAPQSGEGKPAAGAIQQAPAESVRDPNSYPYNVSDNGVLWEDLEAIVPQAEYDTFVEKHGAALDGNKPEGIKAAQDLLAKHDTVMKSGTVERQVSNPDSPKSPKVRAGTFELADDAIRFLATKAQDPFHRQVATRITRFVAGTRIRFVTQEDMQFLPDKVVSGLTPASPAGAYLDGNHVTVYFLGDTNESLLLHELVHVATMRALDGANNSMRREAEALRQEIVAAFTRVAGTEKVPGSQRDIAKFFATVVSDPDELFAYAYSSPTLRTWLSEMTADGKFQDEAAAQARKELDAKVEKPAGLTLWQKVVDYVRKLLGLNPANQQRLEDMLIDREARIAGIVAANRPASLYSRLDKLLNQVLAANNAPAKAAEPAMARGTQSISEDLLLPDALEDSGLKAKATRIAKEAMGGWKSNPWMLGWLTNRQIGDRFKHIPGVSELIEIQGRMSTKAKQLMGEAHLVDQEWARLDAKVSLEMQRTMLESTIEEMHLIDPTSGQPVAFTAKVNAHLQDTPRNRQKFLQLQAKFNALPAEAKQVYRDAQRKLAKDWDERGRLLRERIIDQYRADLSAAVGDVSKVAAAPKAERDAYIAGAKLSPNARRAVRGMWSDLDAHGEVLAQRKGPYFPLVRFGKHVVVAKSAKFLAAQKAYKDAADELARLNDSDDSTDDQLKAARAKVQETRKAVSDLKGGGPGEYVVEFYEKGSQANERVAQLKKFYADNNLDGTEVYSELRDQHFARLDSVTPGFMNKLEEALSANLSDKDAGAVRAAVRDIYIQSMPERSALKQQLARMGVAGAKATEVRRAFAAAGMRNAWHLSRLEHNLPMHEQLNKLRGGDSDEAKILGGEMSKRFVSDMTFDEGNLLATSLANASYLTYLGLSPSFFVLNAAQPWLISLPIMAGRFGMGAPARELGKAFNDVAGAMKASLKDQKTWRFELDLNQFTDPDERAMLAKLTDKGIIDVTIEHDLGSVASGEAATWVGEAMKFASLPAHHTEVLNRVMTALAAYRLDKRHSATQGTSGNAAEAKAIEYAERIVAETHLDYTPENAPRLMRSSMFGGFGRVIFQFKKYMQGMIFLWAKALVDASRGDREAARGAAYLAGTMVGVAGVSGLPVASVAGGLMAAIAKLWDDDDEPEIAQMLYAGLKDAVGETVARAIVKGLPAALGVDLSSRVGQGALLAPTAFARDQGKEGADWVMANLFALAGPAPSMVANWAEAAVVAEKDPVKALSMALPKVLADPLRAADRADRGVTTRNGQVLIAPEEFGPLGLVMRSVGFESTDVTDMYDKRAAFLEMKSKRDDARKDIIATYVSTRQSGEPAAALLERVRDYNERHPTDRITQSDLLKAVAKARRESRASAAGTALARKPRDREIADRLE